MRNRPGFVAAAVASSLFAFATACDDAGAPQALGDEEYVDRMAREHAGDTPTPNVAAGDDAVEASEIVYATLDGTEVRGYLARPAGSDAPAPGVIVIHEWWGLNDNIKTMARKLASGGYAALAVDLYEGGVAEDPAAARELVTAAMARPARVQDNLRQAYAYLETQQGAPRVGTIGWCFGGGWSLGTALLLPDQIDATVIYYGRVITDPAQLEPLKAPILGLFGADDSGIPVASVREFEAALAALGKPAEIVVYDGADHAFANPSGTRYQAEAAADAWRRTEAFFAQHLQ
jgi:carboxymethylenebutenolidase